MQGRDPTLVLVLGGVVVGALAGAAISLMKILADPYDQLPAITFWLLGSLASVRGREIANVLPAVVVGLVPLVLLRWRINVLSLGDEEAKALGLEAGKLRAIVIAAATLITASVVAISGVIGWVGLVIPHIARMLVGPNFERLLPAAMLMGAGYLVLVDTLARSLGRIEVPIGILTAVVGAPFFLWLLWRGRHGWAAHEAGNPRSCLRLPGTPRRPRRIAIYRARRGAVPARPKRLRENDAVQDHVGIAPAARRPCYARRRQSGGAHSPRHCSPHRLRPAGIDGSFPYTALDLVLMGRVAHRGLFAGPTREDRDVAGQALSDLGIASLRDRDVTRLSGGQRQLVMIARALAQAAPLIVMDEPTASLDFGNQVTVLNEIRRIAARSASGGAGVILSTHDPNHAFAVATRVALMRDGMLLALGTPADVLTAERLGDVYGVPVTVETLASGRAVCAPVLG